MAELDSNPDQRVPPGTDVAQGLVQLPPFKMGREVTPSLFGREGLTLKAA